VLATSFIINDSRYLRINFVQRSGHGRIFHGIFLFLIVTLRSIFSVVGDDAWEVFPLETSEKTRSTVN
jgi:hypothetical protein